ncbi:MAG: imidazolonepropionase [Chitinophagales bacterium]
MATTYQLIGPFTQLLPLNDLPLRGALKDDSLHIIANGGILCKDGYIFSIGQYADLLPTANALNAHIEPLNQPMVALPGFVDMHTHICFAGSRARDYAMRNAGKSYLEIARAGGGIWDTVQHTRQATLEELIQVTMERANRCLAHGVTTIEVKSGYGLSVEEELKMLRAIQAANKICEADLVPTCLAAHILPKDFSGGAHEAYLNHISETLFPILQAEQLTKRMDVFIEEEAFSPTISKAYLQKAQAMGFDLTIHADQFHAGGSAVAVELNAQSADHLEASTDKEIELLAKSDVVAAALPGATLGLGCAFTPARKLLNQGACLAIASDWNPGSAPMGDLLTQTALLGTFEKLSNAELLAGITFRAAHALHLPNRGRLQKGFIADIVTFPSQNYQDIYYYQGQMKPTKVWKKGNSVSLT